MLWSNFKIFFFTVKHVFGRKSLFCIFLTVLKIIRRKKKKRPSQQSQVETIVIQARRTINQLQNQIFIKRRWCSLYDEIGRKLYFSSCYRTIKPFNSDVYYRQLDELDTAIEQKRPELMNSIYGIPPRQCQKLFHLGWDFLMHLPHFPDLATWNFHLFTSLQNSLNSVNFNSVKDVKNHLLQFFATGEKNFYERWIFNIARKMVKGCVTKWSIYSWIIECYILIHLYIVIMFYSGNLLNLNEAY